MRKSYIDKILDKYFQSPHVSHIQSKFGHWFFNGKEEAEKEKRLEILWNGLYSVTDESTLEALDLLNARINKSEQRTNFRNKIFRTLFRQIAAVVIVALISSVGVYYITKSTLHQNRMIECFVDSGDQKFVELHDGTKVWINSGSLLIYPNEFNGDTRTVFLNGEANFDVAKNKNKPFIVKTNKIDIEALGTVFNVKAYSELPQIIATLEEGSIRVDSKTEKAGSFILSPNEQVVYNCRTNEFAKKAVDAERIASWKEGYLVFQEAGLDEIFYSISHRFNVLIKYDKKKYTQQTFTVRFSQDENLNQVFGVLKEIINEFDYKISGNIVTIN